MSCYGEERDGATQNDANRPRTCTDVLWLCFFILFWFVMIFIAAFAYVFGNPLRLINGYDSFGNTCGTRNNEKIADFNFVGLDTSGRQYLFYLDVRNIRNSLKLCVKECPDQNLNSGQDIRDFYARTGSSLCMYNYSVNSRDMLNRDKDIAVFSSLGPCPVLPVYDSVPVLNRCVPRPIKEVADQVFTNLYSVLNSWDTVEQVLGDLYATWREILGLTILAFVLSLVMIAILHLLASLVAWIFMIIVSIAAIVGTGVLWWTYVSIKKQLDNTPESQMLTESVNNESAFLIYSIIATVITMIILLLVLAIRKSISSMAKLFQESAECLAALPTLFALPFCTFIALLAFFAFWVSVVVCLATSSYPGVQPIFPVFGHIANQDAAHMNYKASQLTEPLSPKNISLSKMKQFTFLEFIEPSWVRYMWWLYLIGLVWVSEFILSCQQMVIAGAVAQWIFSNRRKESGSVLSSMGTLICYHLGSVAKGSMLITIFKLPRLILTYIHRKMKRSAGAGSECARCGVKACICCFYCLENFIKFINHNAYTVIAMQGYNFCTSARINAAVVEKWSLKTITTLKHAIQTSAQSQLAKQRVIKHIPVSIYFTEKLISSLNSEAFTTLVNNALDLATLNSVGDFILFLGKCFVTAATGSIGLIIMKHNPHLHFYAVPTLVVCIFAYFIAHSVLSLYEVLYQKGEHHFYGDESLVASLKAAVASFQIVIDTMFLCLCEGKEMYGNDWEESFGNLKGNPVPSTELQPMNT